MQRGIALLALALAAGSLAACGDDGDDGGGGGTPASVSRLWVVPDTGAPVLTEAQRTAFTDGGLYANAHTSANQAGEIRGQLDRSGTVRLAVLTGAQEAPTPVTTSAIGAGALSVDEASGAARGFVLTSLSAATAAHIHLGARGVAGNVIVTLAGGPDVWVVPDGTTLTAEQVTAFLEGRLYYNVHTAANQGGEIRGQIDKSGTVRLASMNGAQETPAPITTAAYGAGMLSVDDTDGEVAGFIVTSGLTATQAHVHQEARGTGGSVIVPLVGGPNLWVVADDRAPLTAEQRTAFTAGNLYFNAHTAANTGGEIRGQLDKTGAIRFAPMTGAQEVPPVTTSAIGAAVFAVDGSTGNVAGFFATTGITAPTVAHVHPGARGASGSPIVPLGP